ncbi:branched-chain amino acid ABC transporter permease [Actinocorallia populi]|uniref:branched-chain amino acid ABC transporter permease n=1 Tax=Actinocorallia populi TaxID=2079200 RepID=UPI000D090B97|nr:branched-chain amino acid ABC transporter permease [Actinocorallia populi]
MSAPTTASRRSLPWPWIAAVVWALAVPFLFSDYDLLQLSRVWSVALAVASLNLLSGYAGQVSAGHGALFGLGAYTGVLLVGEGGMPWPVALLGALVLCLGAGALLGLPALRVDGLGLGLITIAVAALFPLVVTRFESLTGGAVGYALGAPPLSAPGWTGLADAQFAYLVVLAVCGVAVLGLRNLTRGRFGRSLEALRTSSLMAVSNGVETRRLTLTVFALSAGVAGLAGALNALALTLVTPDTFTLAFSLTLLAASVVGGTRSWAGAIVGGAFVTYLPQLMSDNMGGGSSGQWAQVAYAAVLLLVLYFAPRGVVTFVRAGLARLGARRTREKTA